MPAGNLLRPGRPSSVGHRPLPAVLDRRHPSRRRSEHSSQPLIHDQFSAIEKTTNVPYSDVVRLFGDDTSVAGDPISAAPDDAILGGVLAVNTVQANGQSSLAVTLTKTLGKTSLNEDTG